MFQENIGDNNANHNQKCGAKMNAFDVVIVVIISFCLIRGLFRGFIREVSSIIGVIAGFYGAYTYYPIVATYLGKWIKWGMYGNIISFFLLFCLIFSLISFFATLIRYFLNIIFLGWVDRACGMFFGAVKGFLIVSVLFIGLTTFLPPGTGLVAESRLCSHLADFSQIISIFVPQDMKGDLQNKIEGIKEIWKQRKSAVINHKV